MKPKSHRVTITVDAMSYLPEDGYRTIGIITQIPWPLQQQVVYFRGHELHLLPGDKECARMIRVRTKVGFNQVDADKLILELLSALSWAEQQSAVTQGGNWSTAPLNVGRSLLEVTGEGHFEYLVDPADAKSKFALALYREGMSVNLTPYKVLGFFKVINIIRDKGKDQKDWIRDNLQYVSGNKALKRLAFLQGSETDVAKYLYESGRCAVAHAFQQGKVVNPDDPADLIRLHEDLPVIQELARIAIERELGVKSKQDYREEHLYELEGFRTLLGAELIQRIKSEEEISITEIPLPKSLSLKLQGKESLEPFENMETRIEAVKGGAIAVRLKSKCGYVSCCIYLDFAEERLVSDPQSDFIYKDDGTPDAARKILDFMKYYRWWYGGNGILEVFNTATGKRLGRTKPYMPPVNRRFPHEEFEALVKELQRRVVHSAEKCSD